MNGDRAVTATFTQDEYTLSVGTVGSGSVEPRSRPGHLPLRRLGRAHRHRRRRLDLRRLVGRPLRLHNPDSIVMNGDRAVTATFTQDDTP